MSAQRSTNTVLLCVALAIAGEGAAEAATYTVTNLNGSGPGSLAQAVIDANAPGADDIVFAVGGTINPTATLTITDDETRILGATAPETMSGPDVFLDNALGVGAAIRLSGVADCVIEGLRIERFAVGIDIHSGSSDNRIGGTGGGLNQISDNGHGVRLRQAGTEGNTLFNNRINGNAMNGVYMLNGASRNRVGGIGPGEANAIYNNTAGVFLDGLSGSVEENVVQGNFVGTDFSGTAAGLGNAVDGVVLTGIFCVRNEVLDNVIVDNGEDGIALEQTPSLNKVRGNRIGVDALLGLLGNGMHGVSLRDVAQEDTIGPGNIIGANGGYGIAIQDINTHGHHVFDNGIGTDTTATLFFPNLGGGILIESSFNLIGDADAARGNVIARNMGWGIEAHNYTSADQTGNRIWGNTLSFNTGGGVWFGSGFVDNQVGNHAGGPGSGNRIEVLPGNAAVLVGETGAPGGSTPVEIEILTNSTPLSPGPKIRLEGGGNDDIPAPTVTAVTPATIEGDVGLAGNPETVVQVFYDDAGAGVDFTYVGSDTVAAGSASWSVAGTIPYEVNVVATNTSIWPGRPNPQTSEFSAPYLFSSVDVGPAPEESVGLALRLVGPNPTRGVVGYTVGVARSARVELSVYSVEGRLVDRRLSGRLGAGRHRLEWKGLDASGFPVPSGVYLLVARSGSERSAARALLIR